MRLRHELLPRDFQRRLNFARWLTERCRRNKNFLRNLVVGNKATFCMNGQVNSRNVRAYVPAGNPPAFHYDVSCSRQKWIVWLGLCESGQLIGPFFFQRSVNGINYLQMINNDVLPQFLQHFELQEGGGCIQTSLAGSRRGPSTSSSCCYCSPKGVVTCEEIESSSCTMQ